MTTEIKSTQTDRIRTFNDELRKNFSYRHAVMTIGIAALGAEAVARIVKAVEVYDEFRRANDPYKEHDFGSFEIEGHASFSKLTIDPTLTPALLDLSDSAVTRASMAVEYLASTSPGALAGKTARRL